LERKIEPDYERAFIKLSDAVNICLQKELKVISSNFDSLLPEILLKYLILFREFHKINPIYSVECRIDIDPNFSERDNKEKRLFILNILNIIFDAFMSDECTQKLNISDTSRINRFVQTMEIYFKAISHPCVYSMISDIVPRFASWATKKEDTKARF
jgi:hypothetical protein